LADEPANPSFAEEAAPSEARHLSYHDLQRLAKQHGIKANAKMDVLKAELASKGVLKADPVTKGEQVARATKGLSVRSANEINVGAQGGDAAMVTKKRGRGEAAAQQPVAAQAEEVPATPGARDAPATSAAPVASAAPPAPAASTPATEDMCIVKALADISLDQPLEQAAAQEAPAARPRTPAPSNLTLSAKKRKMMAAVDALKAAERLMSEQKRRVDALAAVREQRKAVIGFILE
jgi:hypothetical protein